MKFFLLMGGTAGFLLAFAGGLMAGNEISIALREGALGCVVGAILMKGFHAVFMMCLHDLAAQQTGARAAANPDPEA